MIISRTPYRISFFGGGTDYPTWYRRHGGQVLATTIDKYSYITCRYLPPFFEHRYCIMYSQSEYCQNVDEIRHPAIREVLKYVGLSRGLEIHHDGDLPARSGMGSSSAFTVGFLHAIHALCGRMATKKQLTVESIHLEQEVLRETVGSQDQVQAAYGGFNHVTFTTGGDIAVRPMTISRERLVDLNSHLMLFYTGIKRTASDVAATFAGDLDVRHRQLSVMNDMVDECVGILASDQRISKFGDLLNEAWQTKRSLSAHVSNPQVDEIYERALNAGAIGGKLTGAGGGGFLLLFVEPDRQNDVREELVNYIHVPFKFEHSGSQIIFCDREEEYVAEEQFRESQQVRSFEELIW